MPTLRTAHYTDLFSIAWALWHVWTKQQDASALATGVKVAPDLYQRASERRSRMIRVLDYNAGEEPDVQRALADIRRGSGYQDTASDLVRLARLYVEHESVLSLDGKNYRPDDVQAAHEDAGAIVQALSTADQSDEDWSDLQARAWTLLNHAYNEVAAAVSWLQRDDLEIASKYPSLYAVARPNQGRPRSSASEVASDAVPQDATPSVGEAAAVASAE